MLDPNTHENLDRPRQRDHTTPVRPVAALVVLVGVLAVFALAGLLAANSGVVSAQAGNTNTTSLNDTAPYYANETPVGNQSGWFPAGSDVTLDVLGEMTSRLGSFVIGAGNQIPGGTTFAGTIITGIVVVAVFLGAVTYTSVGSTGGVVVAATVGYGMTSVGLAPPWLKIVLLFVIASIAAVAALRVTN